MRLIDLSYDPSKEWGSVCANEVETRRVVKHDAPSKRQLADLTENRAKPVYDAILYLAGHCDGARAHDGAGFSAYDADIGHSFARSIKQYGRLYSSKQFDIAKRLCRKYRVQLAAGGFDLDVVLATNYDAKPPASGVPTCPQIGKVLVIGDKALKVVDDDARTNWWPRSQMLNIKVEVEDRVADFTCSVLDLRVGDRVHFDAPKWLAKKKAVAAD